MTMRVTFTNPIRRNNIYNAAFKAHFYKANLTDDSFTIKTDNEKQLGEEPSFEYLNNRKKTKEEETIKDEDGLFYAKFAWWKKYGNFKYKINYKDTGKVDDNNGEYYSLDYSKMYDKTNECNYKLSALKKVIPLARGKAQGKVIMPSCSREELLQKLKENITTPYILLVKDFWDVPIPFLPLNVVGLISLGGNYSILAHHSTNIRTRTDASAFVTDEKMFKNFEKYLGKYAEIETNKDSVTIKEIDKSQVHFNKKEQIIKIPKLRPVDKLLTTQEYSRYTVGAKALNLAKLEKLKKENKIDAIIPPSFAVPYAFIDAMREENTQWHSFKKAQYIKHLKSEDLSYSNIINLQASQMLEYDFIKSDKRMSEIMSMIEKTGIKGKRVMVRSAFNGEDLSNYSAAGLYDSESVRTEHKEDIYEAIHSVAASKWNNKAVISRQQHKISHENIQPTVIIQEEIPADYIFTAYTKDEDNKLRIEMYSKNTYEPRLFHLPTQPYAFIYNPETDSFIIEQKENVLRKVTFDENLNIVDVEKFSTPAADNFEKFKPALKRIVKNALAIEKAFGSPQDIEGGLTFGDEDNFKDEKLYIWQTRNIVFSPETMLKISEQEFLTALKKDPSKKNFKKAFNKYGNSLDKYLKEKNYEILYYDEIPNGLPHLYNKAYNKQNEVTQEDVKAITDYVNNRIAIQESFLHDFPDTKDPSSFDFLKTVNKAVKEANTQNRKIKIVNADIAEKSNQYQTFLYHYDAFKEVIENAIDTSPKDSPIEIHFMVEEIESFGTKYPKVRVKVKSLKDDTKSDILKNCKNNLKRIYNWPMDPVITEDSEYLTVKFSPRVTNENIF